MTRGCLRILASAMYHDERILRWSYMSIRGIRPQLYMSSAQPAFRDSAKTYELAETISTPPSLSAALP